MDIPERIQETALMMVNALEHLPYGSWNYSAWRRESSEESQQYQRARILPMIGPEAVGTSSNTGGSF